MGADARGLQVSQYFIDVRSGTTTGSLAGAGKYRDARNQRLLRAVASIHSHALLRLIPGLAEDDDMCTEPAEVDAYRAIREWSKLADALNKDTGDMLVMRIARLLYAITLYGGVHSQMLLLQAPCAFQKAQKT
jgi:hypothetical protein